MVQETSKPATKTPPVQGLSKSAHKNLKAQIIEVERRSPFMRAIPKRQGLKLSNDG